jgi:predicted XRE-type DNA-binding protein
MKFIAGSGRLIKISKGKEVYTQTALYVYNHDFVSLQTGLAIPFGIYDVKSNQACIKLNSSHYTSLSFSLTVWFKGDFSMTIEHEKSSGNVFADLGFPNSEQELVKAKLTARIYRLLKDQGLTQIETAKLLGTTQARVSALMRCRPVSISVGRLMEF